MRSCGRVAWLVGLGTVVGLLVVQAEDHVVAAPHQGGSGALLVRPEQPWAAYQFAALSKVLEGQEIPYTIAADAALDDPALLAKYDLVALSIRRVLSVGQAANLKEYVARGGALWASWGGPTGSAEARAFCRDVFRAEGRFPSIHINDFTVLAGSPITRGIPERLAFRTGKPVENMELQVQPGATRLLGDREGRCLGVASEHGAGRAVLLGITLESAGAIAPREKTDQLTGNMLRWLLRDRAPWDNDVLDIAIPAQANPTAVAVDGQPVAKYAVRELGSLKRIRFRTPIADGGRYTVRIGYEPLTEARNVECIAHFPSGSIERSRSPAHLANLFKTMNVTIALPHVHGAYDNVIYNGLAEDRRQFESPAQARAKYGTSYRSDFLAELIKACHDRGIKLYASLYLGCRLARAKYPEVIVINKDGSRDDTNWACFNNPKTMEHNWAMLRHLLDHYKIDGLIYDDNFGLDCYCPLCKQGFEAYCRAKGWPCVDPQKIASTAAADTQHWLEYRQSVVHGVASKLAKFVQDAGRPAGAWVSASLGNDRFAYTNEALAARFDFLGGMTYTGYSPYANPCRDTRAMAGVMGKCRLFALLWGPNKNEQEIVRDVYDAINGGCDATGFWCLAEKQKVNDWEMLPGSFAAIGRALADVENIWMGYYQRNLLAGDRRLTILKGTVGRDSLALEVGNSGAPQEVRLRGPLDLSALIDLTPGYRPERGILPRRPDSSGEGR